MHAPLTPKLMTEWRTLGELAPLADAWRALATRALEPNVFYEPAFALAAAPAFGAQARAVLVWSPAGRLMGLFPMRPDRFGAGLCPALIGWTHPYAPLGTPLVDRDAAEDVIGAWLDAIAGASSTPPLLLLPMTPEHGPFAVALDTALSKRGCPSTAFGRHERAILQPSPERGGYIEHAIGPRKRKDLRRQRRRLEDIASVTFNTAADPEQVAVALKDFMALEASGWKGVAGTAVVDDPNIRAFVENAVTALAAAGKARIDSVLLNGCSIAVGITLLDGDSAWFWKIAYSEGLSRFSPGVQLAFDLTEALLRDESIARADSCATAGHPMIDHLWRERLALSDRLIAVKPSVLPFTLVCRIEALRRKAFATAKDARNRYRRRQSRSGSKQPADDLAGGRHRHFVDESDLARILMRRQTVAHEVLDLGGKTV